MDPGGLVHPSRALVRLWAAWGRAVTGARHHLSRDAPPHRCRESPEPRSGAAAIGAVQDQRVRSASHPVCLGTATVVSLQASREALISRSCVAFFILREFLAGRVVEMLLRNANQD
jgi:hypothetical protein